MIASGSAPVYDAEFAFIGLYIVEPAFRGKVFACHRMYLRGDPDLPLNDIFRITSFEAG